MQSSFGLTAHRKSHGYGYKAPPQEIEVTEGITEVQFEIDEDVDISVDLLDNSGHSHSTISLSIINKHEDQKTALSFFDALVRNHQDSKSNPFTARAAESWLRRAENELLARHDSWIPVIAGPGWSNSNPRSMSSTTRTLGTVTPQVDPRPSLDQFSRAS